MKRPRVPLTQEQKDIRKLRALFAATDVGEQLRLQAFFKLQRHKELAKAAAR